MAHYESPDSVPYGETSVPMGGGIVLDSSDQCAYCGADFEVEDDEDEDGYPVPHVVIPVECDKGNFCSEQHRVQSMYEAQDDQGKQALKAVYLGASLIEEKRRAALEIVEKWELDGDLDSPQEILATLSPDGGIRGKDGIEDACEVLLLPQGTRTAIWSGLWRGKMALLGEVVRAQNINPVYLGESYKQAQIKWAQDQLAVAEAALKALDGLRSVLA